jgi:hypothetical protein
MVEWKRRPVIAAGAAYNRELDIRWPKSSPKIIDIVHPFVVISKRASRYTDHLHVAGCKVRGSTGDFTKLSGANRGEIGWM